MNRLLIAIFAASAGQATALIPLPIHIDLQPIWNTPASTWSWAMRVNGDGSGTGNNSGELRDPLLHFMPVRSQAWEDGGDMLLRPGDPAWDFMGTPAGQPIWFIPQTDNGYTWAGFNNTQSSLFAAYTETDPRVADLGSQKWLTFRLKRMEGPEGGHVCLYNNYSDGSVVLWMATSDGIDSTDTFFMRAGDHSHTNWGFTRKGVWRISVSVLGYRGANKTNPTPESPDSVFIFGVGNHASWRASHFTNVEVMDESIAGPMADPDSDGVANLLEYAFGGNPTTAAMISEAGCPLLPRCQFVDVASQRHLSLTYYRRKAETHPDIQYRAEWQSGLGSASWQEGGTETMVISVDETWDEVTVRDGSPFVPGSKRFGRIKIVAD